MQPPERLKKTADALVAACRKGEERRALETLYAEDSVSVESYAEEGVSAEAKGRAAIAAKHDWWADNFEVLDSSAEGPFFHGEDRFGVIFKARTMNKKTGEETRMTELGLYSVDQAGKIIREEFFRAG
jgi:hypothetical protein